MMCPLSCGCAYRRLVQPTSRGGDFGRRSRAQHSYGEQPAKRVCSGQSDSAGASSSADPHVEKSKYLYGNEVIQFMADGDLGELYQPLLPAEYSQRTG